MHFKTELSTIYASLIKVAKDTNTEKTFPENRLIVFTSAGAFIGDNYDPDNSEQSAKICIETTARLMQEILEKGTLTGGIGCFFLTNVSFYPAGFNQQPSSMPFVQLFSDQIVGFSIGSISAN